MLSAMRAKSFPRTVLALGAAFAATATPLLSGCTGPGSPDPERATTYGSGLASIRAALTRPGREPVYYLALGDSLSRGIQPGPGGYDVMSGRGYADRLAVRLRD